MNDERDERAGRTDPSDGLPQAPEPYAPLAPDGLAAARIAALAVVTPNGKGPVRQDRPLLRAR